MNCCSRSHESLRTVEVNNGDKNDLTIIKFRLYGDGGASPDKHFLSLKALMFFFVNIASISGVLPKLSLTLTSRPTSSKIFRIV